MNMKQLGLGIKVLAILGGALATPLPSNAAQVLVDVNQLMPSEEGSIARLRMAGVWSANTSNSPLHWGHVFNGLGPSFVVSEDLYSGGSTPFNDASEYAAVSARLGRAPDVAMVYKEPYACLTGGEIENAARNHGGKIVVDARDYLDQAGYPYRTDLENALKHVSVRGVCFEVTGKTLQQGNYAAGVQYVLSKNKQCYLILPPAPDQNNYLAYVQSVVAYLQRHDINLNNNNLFLVVAAYDRSFNTVGFYTDETGPNSLEAAVDWLRRQ